MNRKFLIPTLMLLYAIMLSGCRCSHEWAAANCTDPERCSLCGARQGDPLGHCWTAATCQQAQICQVCGAAGSNALPHSWTDATCEQAKTCTVCSTTEGSPLEHSWIDASCEKAKFCETCGKTEGELLGHSWTAANCTTPKTCARCNLTEGKEMGHHWIEATAEAPKTCTVCGATEGEAIPDTSHFFDTARQSLLGNWRCSTTLTAEDLGLTGCVGAFTKHITLTFRTDGTVTAISEMDDVDTLEASIIERVYSTYAERGMSRSEADLVIQGDYGKTVSEYAASLAAVIIRNNLPPSGEGIYFVTDDLLHFAQSQGGETTVFSFLIQNSTLTLANVDTGEILDFTRNF